MDKKNKKLQAEEVTTINELAVMMRDAFQGNQDYMDKKFTEIGDEFRHVHYKLETIEKKLDNHEKTLFSQDQKMDKLEVDMKKVKKILAI